MNNLEISKIIFERLGGWGLGNSMFQIATTIAIAKNNNLEYYFPDDCYFKKKYYDNIDKCYFKTTLPFINFKSLNNIVKWGFGGVGYLEPLKIKNTNETLVIDGFFQNEKYFYNYKDILIEIFDIKEKYKKYIHEKYNDILNKNNCSLHIRRGDYLTAKEMKVLDIQYYKNAIKYFDNDTIFIIFSDDIQWCKNNLDFIPNKYFIEENNDILEIYLMKNCKNNIIANSTFSWWGAWLNKNNKVIMPNPKNNWFSDIFYDKNLKYNFDYNSLSCENWIII
jgi:hypothetical protein